MIVYKTDAKGMTYKTCETCETLLLHKDDKDDVDDESRDPNQKYSQEYGSWYSFCHDCAYIMECAMKKGDIINF